MPLPKAATLREFAQITELSHLEARSYFRDSKHYVNFDLPPYFNFEEILLSASAIINQKDIAALCMKTSKDKPDYPCNYPDVNYVILSNKDGGFAWRQMQIIHPVLYMDLVNLITQVDSWTTLSNFFQQREKSCVECISIPLKSNIEESNKAVSVSNWWDKIEQESLRRSLDYKFMFQTDISNCYPSIYTHSIEWALCAGGRVAVKNKRTHGEKTDNLGTEIDKRLRYMNQGQTIGIPQGSVLMDFIAEIVLAGTDNELTEKIYSTLGRQQDFKILRYRDDYRIFSNEYKTAHSIMKILNGVLYNWNMRINTAKTSDTSDIITASIKSEKLEEIYTAPTSLSIQKEAMRIYVLSKKHPNAGLVARHLTGYYDRLNRSKKKSGPKFDYEVVLAIVTMIGYHSPRYMPQVASIISRIVELSGTKLNRKSVISKIVSKFDDLPNTEFIDIWLQRITGSDDINSYDFKSSITKVALAQENNSIIWNSEWLNSEDRDTIECLSVSSLPEKVKDGTFSPIIERAEFELYRRDYDR